MLVVLTLSVVCEARCASLGGDCCTGAALGQLSRSRYFCYFNTLLPGKEENIYSILNNNTYNELLCEVVIVLDTLLIHQLNLRLMNF